MADYGERAGLAFRAAGLVIPPEAISFRVSFSETTHGLVEQETNPLPRLETDEQHRDGNRMRDSGPQGLARAAVSAAASEEAEQRGAPRVTVLIRAAKLICDEREFLCVVRDASESGISVRLFHPLPPVDSIVLEMPNGERHRLEAVWLEDAKAGFRFVDPLDFARFIENKSEYSKRSMRVNVRLDAVVRAVGRDLPVEVQNISQQGAQIRADGRLAIDEKLQLSGASMPAIEAKVRWRKDGVYGLVFEDTFQLGDLARFVARAQLGSLD